MGSIVATGSFLVLGRTDKKPHTMYLCPVICLVVKDGPMDWDGTSDVEMQPCIHCALIANWYVIEIAA